MKKLIPILLFLVILGACTSGNKIVITDHAPWYFPTVMQIEPGTTVEWENMGAVVHPVNSLDPWGEYSSGHFTETWEHTFDEPGLYHYFCPVHPYMQGIIGVGMDVPEDMIPYLVKEWPPASADKPIPGPLPPPGVGEVWLDAQFEEVPGKDKPGTIVVIDATTWQVKKKIDHNSCKICVILKLICPFM